MSGVSIILFWTVRYIYYKYCLSPSAPQASASYGYITYYDCYMTASFWKRLTLLSSFEMMSPPPDVSRLPLIPLLNVYRICWHISVMQRKMLEIWHKNTVTEMLSRSTSVGGETWRTCQVYMSLRFLIRLCVCLFMYCILFCPALPSSDIRISSILFL